MKTAIVLVKAGMLIGRCELDRLEGVGFETVEDFLNTFGEDALEMYGDGNLQVWSMTGFMEAWNDTDDDATHLSIGDTFFGHIKIRRI